MLSHHHHHTHSSSADSCPAAVWYLWLARQVWVCLTEPYLPAACSEVEATNASDWGGKTWPPAACFVFLESARKLTPCAQPCVWLHAVHEAYMHLYTLPSTYHPEKIFRGKRFVPGLCVQPCNEYVIVWLDCIVLTSIVGPDRKFAYWGPNPTLLLLAGTDMTQPP